MAQAQRVSDYTAFFLAEEGSPAQVVESGLTDEIFSKPKDPRTNDYVNGLFG
jgi:phosphate transport system ATP-binding protein